MAELADAYGSGPYESNFMQVQVLLSAPVNNPESSFAFRIIFYIFTNLQSCCVIALNFSVRSKECTIYGF